MLENNKRIAWVNGVLATMDPEVPGDYGLVTGQALVTCGEKIEGVTPLAEIKIADFDEVADLKHNLVTPGFIDCHTHLVYGGNRAYEWERRLGGTPYAQIAQEGGGINSTVRATREASLPALYERALRRLKALAAEGVTTVEIKSGYGLNLEDERKSLLAARMLRDNFPMDIVPTLLAAHSVPPEFAGRPDAYLDEVIGRILPELWQEGLFEAVDVFCENIAFSVEQSERLFKAASGFGIPVKAHSEQMSNIGASALVAKYNGLSTDHIERLDEAAIKALAKTRGVATLLPMAYYFLKDATPPPVELLRKHGVPMAVSTDYNPGTSPFATIRQAMNMACTLFGLTPAEAVAGVTRHAAQALGREKHQGRLAPGFEANFAIWEVERPVEIFYELGYNPLAGRIFRGRRTAGYSAVR